MLLRTTRPAVVLLAAIGVAAGLVGAVASPAQAVRDAAGDGDRLARFERWATITKIRNGYYYDAGQQDSRLVVTRVPGGLRYVDRHTDVLRSKPRSCDRKRAKVGLVVVCRVPKSVGPRNPWTVKVFTRLGNDHVDTSALPAAFRLYGLADAGRDVFRGGAGNDFINLAQNRDKGFGGAGNDWIRGNLGRDDLYGGPGNDQLVGVEGDDLVYGGPGNDRVGGGPGHDRLFAGDGSDYLLCGPGTDRATATARDRVLKDCESVYHS